MYFTPKRFFSKITEAVITFVACAWLVKQGIKMLQGVWGWLILVAVLIIIIRAVWKFYKYYKETHFF